MTISFALGDYKDSIVFSNVRVRIQESETRMLRVVGAKERANRTRTLVIHVFPSRCFDVDVQHG
eukprot:1260254-Ditylum_brightwellii.AAC.1